MPRIRSLHPEQFTDDDFVMCSPVARLLCLGVRNQSDDNGIFEWNPVKLKMRILPADNCDVAALLEELAANRQVMRYSVDGKHFGMIRNFQQFQRPKYPSFQYPTPPGRLPKGYGLSERYSGKLTPDSGDGSGNSGPPSQDDSPRSPPTLPEPSRNRGADVVVEESRKPSPIKSNTGDRDTVEVAAVAALRVLIEQDGRITLPAKGRMHLGQWAREGLTPEQLTSVIRKARSTKPHPELIPFAYLVPIAQDAKAGKLIDADEPRGKAAAADALRRIQEREAKDAKSAPSPAAVDSSRAPAREPEPPREEIRPMEPIVDNWWTDPEQVMARAVELQVTIFEGENFDDFTARVLAQLGPGDHLDQIEDQALLQRITYFTRIGPTSDAARPTAS